MWATAGDSAFLNDVESLNQSVFLYSNVIQITQIHKIV